MSKEVVAILGLGLTLIAAVFGFGMRIGTLTERVETQTKQIESESHKIEALATELAGINQQFILYSMQHQQDENIEHRVLVSGRFR